MAVDAINELVDFSHRTSYADLPGAVRDRSKIAVLDTLASTLAGVGAQGSLEIDTLVSEWGGNAQATIMGSGRRTSIPLAVLVNATSGRALDLDDVHDQSNAHPTVNVVAPLLAFAEGRPTMSGAELIASVAISCEVICRVALAPTISPAETGGALSLHTGYLGSAIASARALRLSVAHTQNALGIAYGVLAGNRQLYEDGAVSVRVTQGFAAEAGVRSALLAQRGVTGARSILEGKYGYFPVFHRGQYCRDSLIKDLGKTWEYVSTSVKPGYPCCKFTHGPADAMKKIANSPGYLSKNVQRIEVTVSNKDVHELVCMPEEAKWSPRSIVDAQFSLPFVVAYVAVHETLDLDYINPSNILDPDIKAMAAKVIIKLDRNENNARERLPMPGDVEVFMTDGSVERAFVEYVSGHPANPMDFDDVASKFLDCASHAEIPDLRAEQVVEMVRVLEDFEDCSAITRLCVRNE